jgi:hypothetical protein
MVLLASSKWLDVAVFSVPGDSAAPDEPLNFAPGSS